MLGPDHVPQYLETRLCMKKKLGFCGIEETLIIKGVNELIKQHITNICDDLM